MEFKNEEKDNRQRRYYLSKLVQPQFPNRHAHNPLIPKLS